MIVNIITMLTLFHFGLILFGMLSTHLFMQLYKYFVSVKRTITNEYNMFKYTFYTMAEKANALENTFSHLSQKVDSFENTYATHSFAKMGFEYLVELCKWYSTSSYSTNDHSSKCEFPTYRQVSSYVDECKEDLESTDDFRCGFATACPSMSTYPSMSTVQSSPSMPNASLFKTIVDSYPVLSSIFNNTASMINNNTDLTSMFANLGKNGDLLNMISNPSFMNLYRNPEFVKMVELLFGSALGATGQTQVTGCVGETCLASVTGCVGATGSTPISGSVGSTGSAPGTGSLSHEQLLINQLLSIIDTPNSNSVVKAAEIMNNPIFMSMLDNPDYVKQLEPLFVKSGMGHVFTQLTGITARDTAMTTTMPPTSAMPTSAMPTSAMPTSAMPTSAMPTSAMPTTDMTSTTDPYVRVNFSNIEIEDDTDSGNDSDK
jgi:hypothetical protein